MANTSQPKPLFWIASTRDDLREFPNEVRQIIGYGLYLAQMGDKHLNAKPLKGFGGAGTLEIVADHEGDTYRAVYTVRFADARTVENLGRFYLIEMMSVRFIENPPKVVALREATYNEASPARSRMRSRVRELRRKPSSCN